jgi:hypothetical protein
MASCVMIVIPSSVTDGSGIQNLRGEDARCTDTQGGRRSLTSVLGRWAKHVITTRRKVVRRKQRIKYQSSTIIQKYTKYTSLGSSAAEAR